MKMNRMRKSVLVVVAFAVFTLQLDNGSAGEIPVISPEELKNGQDSGAKMMLLNPQTPLHFNEGFIPGSLNIPLKRIPESDSLPADRETLIVVYCRSPRDVVAKQAAELLSAKGYPHIRWFKEGTAAWVAAGYPLEYRMALPRVPVSGVNAVQLHESLPEVVVLDIRPSTLLELGRIKGSCNMPMEDLAERYGDLPKGRKIVVVDHMGNQVILAARFLEQKGFDVQGLLGGMTAWVSEGYPVEK
jgi:rhodanese-related sulfurtransferase